MLWTSYKVGMQICCVTHLKYSIIPMPPPIVKKPAKLLALFPGSHAPECKHRGCPAYTSSHSRLGKPKNEATELSHPSYLISSISDHTRKSTYTIGCSWISSAGRNTTKRIRNRPETCKWERWDHACNPVRSEW